MSVGRMKFDEFELDCGRYELLKAGRRLKLEKIPMELLILLVAKKGDLVTRQEIVERLWGKEVFVDTEHGINTAIRKVRNALRDDPEQPRFVQTVTGKGYRFVAVVSAVENENSKGLDSARVAAAAEGQVVTQPGRALSHSNQGAKRPGLARVIGIAILILLTVLLFGWRYQQRSWPFGNSNIPIQSLAVLPLDNVSGDQGQEFFADGLTDELITMLAKNSSIRVVSRTSVMQYKGAHRPLKEIAQELGVDGIVEGSVKRSGGRVHVTVQLIQGYSDAHIWADSYDRDLNEAAALPQEIAQSISAHIHSRRPGTPAVARYVSPEAHDNYLWGRYYWFADDPEKSAEYFQKAIDLQPDYAAAWSGLADSLIVMAVDGITTPAQVVSRGEAAARRAVALDDQLGEAHRAMAGVYLFGLWNFQDADRESARAVELDPGDSEDHHLRSYVLEIVNRNGEALEEQKKATELDPLKRPWAMGLMLVRLHRFDDALREAQLRTAARPDDASLHDLLADAYRFKGLEKEYAEEFARVHVLVGDQKGADEVRRLFARGGIKAIMEARLEATKKAMAKGYFSPYRTAFSYARLGRKEETLRYLEEAYRERSPWMLS